jgi:hypothetical protein
MRALWTSKVAKGGLERSGAITCFLHREKNGVVYQKPSMVEDGMSFVTIPLAGTMKRANWSKVIG